MFYKETDQHLQSILTIIININSIIGFTTYFS